MESWRDSGWWFCLVNFNLLTSEPNCELPKTVDGGGPAGVKDVTVSGGGPAGVVDGFSAIPPVRVGLSLEGRDLESGVVGGLDEKGTWKDDIAAKVANKVANKVAKYSHQDVSTPTSQGVSIEHPNTIGICSSAGSRSKSHL